MFVGAGFYFSTGIDLWAALAEGDMAGYLAAVGPIKARLVINLSLWIVGVLVLGVAGLQMAELNARRPLAQVARVCFMTAVPLAIIAFIAMLSVVVQIAPDASPAAVTLAEVVGWFGARADDVATALIVGAGPLFLALAGRDAWVPRWLARWSLVTAVAGAVSLVGVYLPALRQIGFLIVPIGLGWMIAAGVTLLRHQASQPATSRPPARA